MVVLCLGNLGRGGFDSMQDAKARNGVENEIAEKLLNRIPFSVLLSIY
jgi:hypothetical protein